MVARKPRPWIAADPYPLGRLADPFPTMIFDPGIQSRRVVQTPIGTRAITAGDLQSVASTRVSLRSLPAMSLPPISERAREQLEERRALLLSEIEQVDDVIATRGPATSMRSMATSVSMGSLPPLTYRQTLLVKSPACPASMTGDAVMIAGGYWG